MVKVKEDLTGRVFGKLKVISQAEDYIRPSNGQHEARWLCECLCEEHTMVIVAQNQLKGGKTKSCGCLRKEALQLFAKQYNKYDLSSDYGIGWTLNTNRAFYFDLENYDKIKNICWYEHHSSKNFSALIGHDLDSKKKIKMHVLLGYQGYDHIDHNELNNLKSNLRPATHQENQCNMQKRIDNTSGVTGVVWSKARKKWIAQIQYMGKFYNLGGFVDKDDAIRARLNAEVEYFKEFAPQQHLYEKYNINTQQNDLEREK